MKVSDYDENLVVETSVSKPDVVWFNAKDKPFKIYGLSQVEKGKPFLRIPGEIAEQVSPGVAALNIDTAGGRIRFRTNSEYIALISKTPHLDPMPHMTWVGQAGYDMYSSVNGDYKYVTTFTSEESVHTLDGKWHTYTINMPLYHGVNDVFIGLSEGAGIEEAEEYTYSKPVLYYGSSITQGGCASRPGNTYESMISRKLDCDYINLGYSGNAKGEAVMADYLASLDASVFVMDYDFNARSAEQLQETHYPMYQKFRKTHPDAPIIMVNRPNFNRNDDSENERRIIILESYITARKAGDNRVFFVDGASIFDGAYADSCTVDGCHPNDLGFYRMAIHIGTDVENSLKLVYRK